MKKKLLTLILVATLCVPSNSFAAPVTGSAITTSDKDYILGREMTDAEIEKQKENEPTLKTIPLDTSLTPQIYDSDELVTFSSEQTTTPTYYNSVEEGYITEVKNQNPYGTCWAFTTVACAEANILKKTGKTFDLSEIHLAYHSYNTVLDEMGMTEGDEVILNSSTSYLNCGGSYLLTPTVFFKGFGFALEENNPYSAALSYSPTAEQSNERAVVLDNAIYINKNDTNTIKKSIMEYGAVGFMYYHDSTYYNYSTGAYYNYEKESANHGVTIVGWNDNYSRENFGNGSDINTMPSGNGAWLVKNSWGTNWGNEGYFWISYEDCAFSTAGIVLCAFDCSIPDYDNIYQYDGSLGSSRLTGFQSDSTICAYYTVNGNPDACERLDSVCFGTGSVDCTYFIQIYKNSTEAKLLDGTPMLENPVTGTINFAGYHSVELPENLYLKQGDTYTVALKITSPTSSAFGLNFDTTRTENSRKCIANSTNDKTFLISPSGTTITNLSAEYGTIRLKARTENVDNISIASINISDGTLSLPVKESKKIGYTVTPSYATENIIWTSNNKNVATVENGTVKAVGKGTATITATAANCQKSIVVNVYETTLISSSMFALEYFSKDYTGEALTPTVTSDIDSSLYTVSYSNNINPGTATVTITANQRVVDYHSYIGSCTLTFTINRVTDNNNNDNNDNNTDNNNNNNTDNSSQETNEKTYTVSLNATSIPLQVKKSTKVIKATLTSGDSIKSWTTSNKKVATVSKSGKITARKVGTAKITVETVHGAKATVKVKVTKGKVVTKKLIVNTSKVTLKKGKSFKLVVSRNPLTATEKIKYTSSNKKIATVSSSGLIKAKKRGTAKITIKSSNGKKKVVKVVVK